MSQFFARLFSMIATDAMVSALANNKRFQYFALRVDGVIRSGEKLATEKAEVIAKRGEQIMKDPEALRRETEALRRTAEQAAEDLKHKATQGGFTFARFAKAFQDEVRKDFGGGK